jgi:hypothetical protein
MSDVAKVNIYAWAEIDIPDGNSTKTLETDITSVRTVYALNRIPIAAVVIPTGVVADNIVQIAATQTSFELLSLALPVRIYCSAGGVKNTKTTSTGYFKAGPDVFTIDQAVAATNNLSAPSPGTKTMVGSNSGVSGKSAVGNKIFDGLLASATYIRTTSGAAISVNLVGRLQKLNSGAAFCADLVGNGLDQLLLRSIVTDATAAASSRAAKEQLILSTQCAWEAALQDDMKNDRDVWNMVSWIMGHMAKRAPVLQVSSGGLPHNDLGYGIKLTEGNKYVQEMLAEQKKLKNPPVEFNAIFDTNWSTEISSSIINWFVGSGVTATMWTKMLQALLPFSAQVIPTVESFLVAPIVCGVHSSMCKTIFTADDYWKIQSAMQSKRVLSATVVVGVVSYSATESVGELSLMGAADQPIRFNAGYPNGTISIVPAPDWLKRYPAQRAEEFTESVGGNNGLAITNTKHITKFGSLNSGAKRAIAQAKSMQTDAGGIATNIARSFYVNEAWGNRSVIIEGRLRFDVLPGTPVAVELPAGQIQEYAGKALYGTVQSVVTTIDCQAPQASTSYTLSHTHVASEEKGPNGLQIAFTKHPYFDTLYTG